MTEFFILAWRTILFFLHISAMASSSLSLGSLPQWSHPSHPSRAIRKAGSSIYDVDISVDRHWTSPFLNTSSTPITRDDIKANHADLVTPKDFPFLCPLHQCVLA